MDKIIHSSLINKIESKKNQLQKNNYTPKNPTKIKVITYSIIGFSLLSLVGFIIVLAKPKRKNSKIKL